MSELPPDARELLQQVRADYTPSSEDRARVRRNLVSSGVLATTAVTGTAAAGQAASGTAAAGKVASGAAGTAASATGGTAAGAAVGAGAKIALGGKLAGALLVSAAVGGGAWGLVQHHVDDTRSAQRAVGRDAPRSAAERPPRAAPRQGGTERAVAASSAPAESSEAAPAESSEAAVEPPAAPRSKSTDRHVETTAERSRHAASSPPARAAPKDGEEHTAPARAQPEPARVEAEPADTENEPAVPDEKASLETPSPPAEGSVGPSAKEPSRLSLASELELIRQAARALADDRPADALEALDAHRTRFADGVLAQERQGLRVLARCAGGQRQAGLRERTRFLKTAPDSPLAERVRRACSPEQD